MGQGTGRLSNALCIKFLWMIVLVWDSCATGNNSTTEKRNGMDMVRIRSMCMDADKCNRKGEMGWMDRIGWDG